MEEQRVRALVARQPIALNLQGLPFERAPTVTDVLMPKIRRSDFNENVNPAHLDGVREQEQDSYAYFELGRAAHLYRL